MMVLIDFVTGNLASASHGYCRNLSEFLLKIFTVVGCLPSCGIEFHFLGTLKLKNLFLILVPEFCTL